MKKEIVMLIICLFLINLVSSAYICSNGEIIKKVGEIEVGKNEKIDQLRLGLAKSDYVSVVNYIEAYLSLDGQMIFLTDEIPSTTIEFLDGSNYNITLLNSTKDWAKIEIGEDSEKIDEGYAQSIKSLDVFLMNLEYSNSEDINVQLMIGQDKIFLSDRDELSKKIQYNNRTFLVELQVASDNDALFAVYRCKNNSAIISEIVDNVEINETQLNNTENKTIINENNLSLENSTKNEIKDINITNISQENNEEKENNEYFFFVISFFVAFLLGIIVVVIVIVRNAKKKARYLYENS